MWYRAEPGAMWRTAKRPYHAHGQMTLVANFERFIEAYYPLTCLKATTPPVAASVAHVAMPQGAGQSAVARVSSMMRARFRLYVERPNIRGS